MHGQVEAVESTPDDEVPTGPVPQSAQKHGEHQISIHLALAVVVASQRYVKVIF